MKTRLLFVGMKYPLGVRKYEESEAKTNEVCLSRLFLCYRHHFLPNAVICSDFFLPKRYFMQDAQNKISAINASIPNALRNKNGVLDISHAALHKNENTMSIIMRIDSLRVSIRRNVVTYQAGLILFYHVIFMPVF